MIASFWNLDRLRFYLVATGGFYIGSLGRAGWRLCGNERAEYVDPKLTCKCDAAIEMYASMKIAARLIDEGGFRKSEHGTS